MAVRLEEGTAAGRRRFTFVLSYPSVEGPASVVTEVQEETRMHAHDMHIRTCIYIYV